MMTQKEFYFTKHNTKLFGKIFSPEKVNCIVILIHGMGEYFGRYEESVIPFLNKHAVAVIAYDQFGHGKTEGKRGHNPDFDAVLDCVTEMIAKAHHIFKNKPIFLYGHSMGGDVVVNYALRIKTDVKGVIATSPFLELAFEPPSWKLKIAKMLSKIAPSLTLGNEIDSNSISRDKIEVEKYNKDSLIHDKVSPNYSVVFIESGKWAIKHASQLEIPMLLLHGTGDKLTSHKASEKFAKNAGRLVELKLFDGAYHELHNDLIKKDVLQTIVNWINKKTQEN